MDNPLLMRYLQTPATHDRSLVMSRGKRFESARRFSFFCRFAGKISELKNVVVLDYLPLDTTRARSSLVSTEAETR